MAVAVIKNYLSSTYNISGPALPSGNMLLRLYLDMIGYLLDDPCSSEGINHLSRSIGSVAITQQNSI